MRNKKLVLYLSLIATSILFFSSCKKDVSMPVSPVMSLNDFPVFKAGNWWKYEVVDLSNGSKVDTVTVKIEYEHISNSFQKHELVCGLYQQGQLVDSATLSYTNYGGLEYTSLTNKALFQNYRLLFPLEQNKTWCYSDSSHVTYQKEYSVGGSTFIDNYIVDYSYGTFNVSETQKIVISRNVGIVFKKFQGNTIGGNYISKTYSLVAYHLL